MDLAAEYFAIFTGLPNPYSDPLLTSYSEGQITAFLLPHQKVQWSKSLNPCLCVSKSISNGFKYFHSWTHFRKQFCFLLQLLGLDWQLWIEVHGSSSVHFLPFPSLTHLLFSNCSNILSVISGVRLLNFSLQWLVYHLSCPLHEKYSKNTTIISFSEQNQASALPKISFLKFCFQFFIKHNLLIFITNMGKPQKTSKRAVIECLLSKWLHKQLILSHYQVNFDLPVINSCNFSFRFWS